MDVPCVKWSPDNPSAPVSAFLERPAVDVEAERLARKVLEDIRVNGDRAVADAIREYDGATLTPAEFRVTPAEVTAARESVDRDFRNAVREAHKRIASFSSAGIKKDWVTFSSRGGTLGEQFVAFERVGVYVPGGAAPLVSTVLMTVTLARVAGVLEIVACTPSDRDGRVNPYLLYAFEIAGATEIYRVGGIQAVGMMAYGTETVRKVQKIVGPGGVHVTAAKRCVYGEVALDLVAGPSEIAILADATAAPEEIAADLLSQLEHGTGHEKALLVTSSEVLARAVQRELSRQLETLGRKDMVRKAMEKGMLLVTVNTLDDGMALCNRFAPEHLEILVREPRTWLKKVTCAGAVFAGSWSPEAVGDYLAGPSHVLPTGGTASKFSGLTVDDFRRRISVVAYTRADLQDALPIVDAFARVEGLDAHAKSARIRFRKK
jgi:histidinol dehydrogenase